jgi:hypothetical protein
MRMAMVDGVRRAGVLVGALALLAACTGGPAREPNPGDQGNPPERQATRVADRNHAATIGRGDRHDGDEVSLQLLSGVTAVTVRTEDIGDDLLRVSTPDDSQIAPVVNGEDPIRVLTEGTGAPGPSIMDIRLAKGLRWNLRFSGGAQDQVVDLRAGGVSGVDFAAGVTRIELSLPKPSGAVTVRMAGGASEFVIHAPDGVPVRLRLAGGAGSATVDGNARSGIAGGTVIEPDGWSSATDRYDVDATAGVSSVVVDRKE